MDIIFKGRHTDVLDRFRRHATAKLAKIGKLDPKAIRIDVEVSVERSVELSVTVVFGGLAGPSVFGGFAGPSKVCVVLSDCLIVGFAVPLGVAADTLSPDCNALVAESTAEKAVGASPVKMKSWHLATLKPAM